MYLDDSRFKEYVCSVAECAKCCRDKNRRRTWGYCIRWAALQFFEEEAQRTCLKDLEYAKYDDVRPQEFPPLPKRATVPILLAIAKSMIKVDPLLNYSGGAIVPPKSSLCFAGIVLQEVVYNIGTDHDLERGLKLSDRTAYSPSYMRYHDDEIPETNERWGHCAKCWRFVLTNGETSSRLNTCELHALHTPGYYKVYRMLKKREEQILKQGGKWAASLRSSTLMLDIPAPLHSIWKDVNLRTGGVNVPHRDNVWYNYGLGMFPPKSFGVTEKKHNMEKIWKSHPYTAKYIERYNGDLEDPLSCLDVLQDVYPTEKKVKTFLKEDDSPSKKTINPFLENIVSRDFGLARSLLVRSEVWLQFAAEQEYTHGGNRTGSKQYLKGK